MIGPRLELDQWPTGVARLLDEAKIDVEQVLAGSEVERANLLSKVTGLPFESRQYPMYFTGDFAASLVMVHLNPKLSDQMNDPGFTSFEDYVEGHQNFGHIHWELDPNYQSNFDRKQVRFLRPFNVIDFLDTADPRHDRSNPARAIDRKLQLELVPYASPDFSARDFSIDYLSHHFERVLDVITAFSHLYVLFCGAVFDDLFSHGSQLVSRSEHRFHLPTVKGTSKDR